MKTQHDSIDTASNLRDLIAVTTEETEAPRPSSIRVELQKEDFAEMRMALIVLRDEVNWSLMKAEGTKERLAKERLVERANSVLGKTDWMVVNFIF